MLSIPVNRSPKVFLEQERDLERGVQYPLYFHLNDRSVKKINKQREV